MIGTAVPSLAPLPPRWRVGVDAVAVARVGRLRGDDAALARLFLPRELARGESQHLAGCLAVKEAVCKALGVTPPRWQDVEVRGEGGERPRLVLAPDLAARVAAADVSVSHDGPTAVAAVLLVLRT